MKWLAVLSFLLLAGCHESTGLTLEDAGDVDTVDPLPDPRDVGWDPDVGVPDIPAEPPPEVRPEVEDDPDAPCTYPPGPYRYTRIGDTVGPASWPTSIRASEETYPLEHADFEVLYCDPDVESIVIFLATLSDSMCPARIREMVSMRDDLDIHKVKFIWILAWDGGPMTTPAMAEEYYSGHGVTFGWFTDDEDNTWEPYIFHNNPFGSGVPWLGVIDAETMQVFENNPHDVLDVVRELARD